MPLARTANGRDLFALTRALAVKVSNAAQARIQGAIDEPSRSCEVVVTRPLWVFHQG